MNDELGALPQPRLVHLTTYRPHPGYDVPAVPAAPPPPGLAEAVVAAVLATIPQAAAMIPSGPAAAFGRVRLPGSGVGWPDPVEALALALDLVPVAGSLTPEVPEAVRVAQYRAPRSGMLAMVLFPSRPWESALARLKVLAPGAVELAAGLARELATHPRLAREMLVDGATEEELATGRGRAHLALAMAVSSVVARGCGVALGEDEGAAVAGLALPVAVSALLHGPTPRGYAAALVEKRRAEFVHERYNSHVVALVGHRFGLVEGDPALPVGEPANGLAMAVPGGLVIRTGSERGAALVRVVVRAERPAAVGEGKGWDEVVELSYPAVEGSAGLPRAQSGQPHDPGAAELTSPWPGPMRALVSADGRDDVQDGLGAESYEIVVWPEAASPDVVHKATDRLGHRLRGEPEPAVVERPEQGYGWIRNSLFCEAASVTVVTGSDPESVLRGFGADPAEPESLRELQADFDVDPWVAVLPVDGAVLALEYNGWQGAREAVLRGLSVNGLACSSYWSVNAVRRLSFARGGAMLDSAEWVSHMRLDDPDVRAAVDGIDFDDHRHRMGKYLLPLARFTGYTLTEADVARIEAADVAYLILPGAP